MNISRRQLIRLGIACAGASLFPKFIIPSQAHTTRESRAIFDESLSWITEGSAENLCQRIKRAGFNVFMPNVWHGRGTSWPSNLAPWDRHRLGKMAKQTPGFDPLTTLITTAQRYEIEVHPWFNVVSRQREFFQEFYDNGTPEESFDVHRPKFRDFIVNLIMECVSRYPVHGVNLDYIRAGSISQSEHSASDYRKMTGRNLQIDRRSYGVSDSARQAIAQWQEQAVGDIVQRVSTQVRKLNKNLVISVCAHPGHSNLYIQGQDSLKWADEGLIDVIYAMHYEEKPDWEGIRKLQLQMKRPGALVVLCGNYEKFGPSKTTTSRDGQKVAQLLQQSRAIGRSNGVGLYLYSMLSDDQVMALRQTVFKVPAKPHWIRGGADVLLKK
ncbi:MAG: family 10 glycosylhydrolase [Solirubrobacterales bacterium]|nr:family 10 glycosylhydrolase [Solirubrobacterales bacterium]